MSIPILTLLVLVPLAGAIAVSLLAKTNESMVKERCLSELNCHRVTQRVDADQVSNWFGWLRVCLEARVGE